MRSLFLKIFVWCWVAMALIGGALVLSIALTQEQAFRPPPPLFERAMGRRRGPRGNSIVRQARRAAVLYAREGREGLISFLSQIEENGGVSANFFDAEGSELSGRPAVSGAAELASQVRDTGEVELKFGWSGLLVAAPAESPAGEGFVLVALLPRRLLGGVEPGDLVIRFLAVLVTAGALCYFLATYLTAPMLRLQKATRELAGGDLTARVGWGIDKRRDEFGELGRDFDRMAERIEQLIRSQQRLLADISHELRSPLARLNVALELARQRAGPQAAGALQRIERETDRMNQLIGQLLSLARLESDSDPARDEIVQLAPLVLETVADANFEAQSRDRSVRAIQTEDCALQGSSELLRSAVENIVRNAVRYTARGTTVEVSLRRTRADAVVAVRDFGPGVPEDALSELFRPFYRVDEARDRQSGGSGLGLAIAARIIRLHRGSIAARNAEGGGLLIEVGLPLG